MIKCKCGKEAFVTICDNGWKRVGKEWIPDGETRILCYDCYKKLRNKECQHEQ